MYVTRLAAFGGFVCKDIVNNFPNHNIGKGRIFIPFPQTNVNV